MQRPAVIRMIEGATAPAISNVFVNNKCSVCALQITGTFTSATVEVEGIVDVNSGAWTTLAAFDLSDLSLDTDGMEDKSIYHVAIEGILRVRVNVTAVTGGSITVVGNFVDASLASGEQLPPANEIPITAYDIAVAGGYTGTYEQFAQDMGNSAMNATNAANSADEAAASATTASSAATNLAPAYSTSATYAVGDHVLHNGGYYVCNTAITTAEAWTAAHWTALKVGPEITDLKNALDENTGEILSLIDAINEKAFSESNSQVFKTISCTTGVGFNAPNKVIDVDITSGTEYTFQIKDPDSCLSGNFAFYEFDSGGNRTYVSSQTSGTKTTHTATINIKGFSLYLPSQNVVNSGNIEIYIEYDFTQNPNSLESRISANSEDITDIKDDITNMQTDIDSIESKLFTALAKARLICCFRNTAWVTLTGDKLLTSFCKSIGAEGWIDVKPNAGISSTDGSVTAEGANRQASDYIDVNGFTTITGVLDDSLQYPIWFAVRCYDENKSYIGTATTSQGSTGTQPGDTKRTLVNGTYYVRLLITPNIGTSPSQDLHDVYTGRMLNLYLYDSSNNESVKAYALTEVGDFET